MNPPPSPYKTVTFGQPSPVRNFFTRRSPTMSSQKTPDIPPRTRRHRRPVSSAEENPREARTLRNICSDSGMCIAFGIENRRIADFFNFPSLNYVVSPITSLGQPSSNGFVKKLHYQHEGYTANAVLKSSMSVDSDNLFYEYFVGLKINEWIPYFPCFIETYSLYMYLDPDEYKLVRDRPRISDADLKKAILLISTAQTAHPFYDYSMICEYSKYMALLIQYISGASTLYDVSEKGFLSHSQLMAIYAQVYFPLGALSDKFAHNDLHSDNVMLYSPAAGYFIHFHYHFADGTVVEFKSYYVAKLIDYGRCYIPQSREVYEELCKTRKCNSGGEKCGENHGFAFMEPLNPKNWYISSTELNPSHDLRLIQDTVPNVVYGKGITEPKQKKFGTQPFPTTTRWRGNHIYNVKHASEYFKRLLTVDRTVYDEVNIDAIYPPNRKFGDIYVYVEEKRRMRFVKNIAK